jgi:hypothetical protein
MRVPPGVPGSKIYLKKMYLTQSGNAIRKKIKKDYRFSDNFKKGNHKGCPYGTVCRGNPLWLPLNIFLNIYRVENH